MTEAQSLMAFLAALYGCECCRWVRQGWVVFRSALTDRCSVAYPSRWLGNDWGGVVLHNPLPPFGNAFHSPPWPIALSPDGVVSMSSPDFGLRATIASSWARFEDIRSIWSDRNIIMINGQPFVRTAGGHAADRYAKLLQTCWQCSHPERDSFIATAISQSLCTASASSLVAAYGDAARRPQMWCIGLFVVLFGLLPLCLWLHVSGVSWIVFGIIAVTAHAGVVTSFQRAHVALSPDAVAQRRKAILLMLLAPFTAVRACDALGKDLLYDYHPLAAAIATCSINEWRAFARRVMRDLSFPRISRDVSDEMLPAAQDILRDFRKNLGQAAQAALVSAGYDPAEFLSPPVPDDPGSLSYCPRCEMQFVMSNGFCEECGGILLHPFVR